MHVQKDQKGLRVDPHRIANGFNDYFTIFAKNLFSKITTKHNFRQFVEQPLKRFVFLSPTSAQEVKKCIKFTDSKKSSNIYGMSAKFLKVICRPVSQVLSNLFNESFSRGIFPDHIKLSLITPVYKGKSKLEVCNYTPNP